MQLRRLAAPLVIALLLAASAASMFIVRSSGPASASPSQVTATALPTRPPPLNSPTPPPAPGDLLWTFAYEPPLFDGRIDLSWAALMFPRIAAVVGSSEHAQYVCCGTTVTWGSTSTAGIVADLAFWGVTPAQIRVVGQCRIWVAPPSVGIQPLITRAEAERLFSSALRDSLAEIGVVTEPCLPVPDPADAALLVWYAGGPSPAIPRRSAATFLDAPVRAPGSPQPPGGVTPVAPPGVFGPTPGVTPLPPRTGHGWLAGQGR